MPPFVLTVPWTSLVFCDVFFVVTFDSHRISGTTLTAVPVTAMVTAQAPDGTRMGPTREVGHPSSLSNNNNLRDTTITLANQWDSNSTLAAGTESKREICANGNKRASCVFLRCSNLKSNGILHETFGSICKNGASLCI